MPRGELIRNRSDGQHLISQPRVEQLCVGDVASARTMPPRSDGPVVRFTKRRKSPIF